MPIVDIFVAKKEFSPTDCDLSLFIMLFYIDNIIIITAKKYNKTNNTKH